MMTTKEVDAWVEEIKAYALDRDYEQAHSSEDYLFETVLKEIAKGHSAPTILADHAIRSLDIQFPRYKA